MLPLSIFKVLHISNIVDLTIRKNITNLFLFNDSNFVSLIKL